MTTEDQVDARAIARYVVEQRLAACVNILDGMNAMYMWQGEFQDGREAVLIAKTTGDRLDALIEAVKEKHSYDCPCIVALPIEKGNPDFLDWIAGQLDRSAQID